MISSVNIMYIFQKIARAICGRILLLIALCLISNNLYSTHYMGGEITWQCLPNGNFRFEARMYRECAGVGYSLAFNLYSNSPAGPIFMSPDLPFPQGLNDLSPVCNPDTNLPHITCASTPFGYAYSNSGAVEEWTFTSDYGHPNGVKIEGVPPPSGWFFYTTAGARNPCSNIPAATTLQYTLRAVMYPYQGRNTYPCFDNAPVFSEKPSSVLMTGYPFTYNPAGYDPDLDSLSFEWAQALTTDLQSPINTYNQGYSYTSPLPGPLHNPNNVPATMNPFTGEISFTSFTQGAFVTVTKVSAFRCGIKVAEVFREMQVVLIPGGANAPPQISTPFLQDTVFAGEVVHFNITAFDTIPWFLPNGDPAAVQIHASGSQFGDNFTSTTSGCLFPPCATLSPPSPVTGTIYLNPSFNWQTSCAHLAEVCNGISSRYNFVFKAQDDFCPVPASITRTVSILLQDAIMPPPKMHCCTLLPNGDVNLSWEMADTLSVGNTFGAYHIFSATHPNGPFTLIDSIADRSITSYTHTGANAINQDRYYFIRVLSGCKLDHYSIASDTLRLIRLSCLPLSQEKTTLNWNSPINPLPSSAGLYQVFRSTSGINWTQISSTAATSFIDSLHRCYDTLFYRVQLPDSIGCFSGSNQDFYVFSDNTPPDAPLLQFVSIDTAQAAISLGWSSPKAPDVAGFVIYREQGGIWLAIDTLNDPSLTFYADISPPADYCQNPVYYTITAFDSCHNFSPVNPQNAHHSLVLNTSEFEPCELELNIRWNPYHNFHPFLEKYQVFVRKDQGPFILLGNLFAPDSSHPPPKSFIHKDLESGSSYCYYVKAFSASGASSTSCTQCLSANYGEPPDFIYLRMASVEKDHIQLRFFVDTAKPVPSYAIFRTEDTTDLFQHIATIPGGASPMLSFSDYQADFNRSSFYYKVVALDSCGNPAIESSLARTILLEVQAQDYFHNTLSWSPYIDWGWAPPQQYRILRSIDGIPEAFPIDPQYPLDTSYLDDVSGFGASAGRFSYTIEALQGPGNPDFRDTVRSNTVEVRQQTAVFIPNAFTPQGANPVFKPVLLFHDIADYQMSIYNRWGQQIFHTNDPNLPWDGTLNNKPVPAGTYVCLLRVRRSDNSLVERRTMVNVIY